MIPMEAMLVVGHVSWFCVCSDELFLVLAGDINVFNCQHCGAGREEIYVVVEYCFGVVIVVSSKFVSITIQLGWEIQFGVLSVSILMSLDVSKRR